MNATDVLNLLQENQNPRGIAHWDKREAAGELQSYGIGLTVLRKLAKQVGRNHELALELWGSEYYDARVVGLLIDEPKKMTREQAEAQVEQLNHGMLRHVFASCDATLAKTPYVVELAEAWVVHADPVRRQCGYGLLYEISKDKRKKAPDDMFFLGHISRIRNTHNAEPRRLRMAMGAALMGIGKRSRILHAASLAAARELGPVPGEKGCDPFDAVKHLTNPGLLTKLGLS